jgi:sirohydrochlorin cobaltochelatase
MSSPKRALLLVGHGSHLSADSSAPVYAHADRIRRLGLFDEVLEAFWKEEPSLRDAIDLIESNEIFVVPLFLAEGYFTRQVLPRELGLAGSVTTSGGRTIHYCRPVGTHASMVDLVLRRARSMPGLATSDRRAATLVVIGHGTNRSPTSADTAYRLVEEIRRTGEFGRVECGFLDEDPGIAEVLSGVSTSRVALVPFFLAEGWHTATTIPDEIGLTGEVTRVGDRAIWYSPPVGTMSEMADAVLAVAAEAGAFDERHPDSVSRSIFPRPRANGSPPAAPGRDGNPTGDAGGSDIPSETASRTDHQPADPEPASSLIHRARRDFFSWLEASPGGAARILQIAIRRAPDGRFRVTHTDDVAVPDTRLRAVSSRDELIALVRFTEDGRYRPLRSRDDLPRGWVSVGLDAAGLWSLVSLAYPAAVLHWHRARTATLEIVPFEQWAARQTGIYQVVRDLAPERLEAVIRDCCGSCLKRREWSVGVTDTSPRQPPEMPLGEGQLARIPCREPCTLFATFAREAIVSAPE